MRFAIGFVVVLTSSLLFAQGIASADTLKWEATAAEKDATYGQYSGGHAIRLPTLNSIVGSKKWVFEGDGRFTEVDGTSAT